MFHHCCAWPSSFPMERKRSRSFACPRDTLRPAPADLCPALVSHLKLLGARALGPQHHRVEERTRPRLAEEHSVSGQVRHQRSELVRGRIGCADLATKATRFEICSRDLAPLFRETQATPHRGYGSRPCTTEAGKFDNKGMLNATLEASAA